MSGRQAESKQRASREQAESKQRASRGRAEGEQRAILLTSRDRDTTDASSSSVPISVVQLTPPSRTCRREAPPSRAIRVRCGTSRGAAVKGGMGEVWNVERRTSRVVGGGSKLAAAAATEAGLMIIPSLPCRLSMSPTR